MRPLVAQMVAIVITAQKTAKHHAAATDAVAIIAPMIVAN